ncbi:calmodulin-related [Lithospermum erythrorhizon]|uniref:Calmodulin-related n=1 Tax=Lithospermum erythrorhizon TaxID=34254 RepID=A0AAV3PEY3_LITER
MSEIANESNRITPSVNGDVEKVFKRFDTNGDGRISIKELESILSAMGSRVSPDEVTRIMSELDVNGDGSIDLKEFVAFQAENEGSNKELKEAFDLYDKDKNGKISASELHEVLKSLGENVSEEDCQRMIKSVDVDGDGCVNFPEFRQMMSM